MRASRGPYPDFPGGSQQRRSRAPLAPSYTAKRVPLIPGAPGLAKDERQLHGVISPIYRPGGPMAHALTHHFATAIAARRSPHRAGDSLDTMRGIIASALVSVLLFWLPLVFLLTR